MRFSSSCLAVAALLAASNPCNAFVPSVTTRPSSATARRTDTGLAMAMDQPPPPAARNDVPEVVANGNMPANVRYSDFLKLVNADRVEKVTFSSDGSQLLGVDVNGIRLAIEALPNDPDLLTQLTAHKVDVTVLPAQEASGLGDLVQSLIFPAVLFAGLFFLSRQAGGGMMGGANNPMGFAKSKAQIQM